MRQSSVWGSVWALLARSPKRPCAQDLLTCSPGWTDVLLSHHLGHHDSSQARWVSHWLGLHQGPWAKHLPFLGLSFPIHRTVRPALLCTPH